MNRLRARDFEKRERDADGLRIARKGPITKRKRPDGKGVGNGMK